VCVCAVDLPLNVWLMFIIMFIDGAELGLYGVYLNRVGRWNN